MTSHIGFFFFQAEDGIRDLVRSRGLGDVYKRQVRKAATQTPKPGGTAVKTPAAKKPAVKKTGVTAVKKPAAKKAAAKAAR